MTLALAQAQRSARQLYRRILRESRSMAPETREFYRRFARSAQGFPSHSGETEPRRIQQIIRRAEQDMHWVVREHKEKGLHTPWTPCYGL